MTRDEMDLLIGELLDESLELELHELCEMCHASEEFVVALVAEGVIEPRGRVRERSAWQFSGRHVRRTQVALRLHRDLGVNLPGVALAVELLEEIERLR